MPSAWHAPVRGFGGGCLLRPCMWVRCVASMDSVVVHATATLTAATIASAVAPAVAATTITTSTVAATAVSTPAIATATGAATTVASTTVTPASVAAAIAASVSTTATGPSPPVCRDSGCVWRRHADRMYGRGDGCRGGALLRRGRQLRRVHLR